MHEVLTRAHEVQTPQPTFTTVSAISHKLRGHAAKKENRRQLQMATAHAKKLAASAEAVGEAAPAPTTEGESSETALGKRKREDGDEATVEGSPSGAPSDRCKTAAAAPASDRQTATQPAKLESAGEDDADLPAEESWALRSKPTFIAKPVSEMRGHTSYLTFAVMYPKAVRDEIEVRYADKDAAKSQAGVRREGSIDSAVSEGFEKGEWAADNIAVERLTRCDLDSHGRDDRGGDDGHVLRSKLYYTLRA